MNVKTNTDPEDPGFKCSFSARVIRVAGCKLGAIRRPATRSNGKALLPLLESLHVDPDQATAHGHGPAVLLQYPQQQRDDGC